MRASLSIGNSFRLSTNMWDVAGTSDATAWFNWSSGTIFANGALDPDDSATWERIVWRLSNKAKPCTAYALNRFVNGNSYLRPHPTDWMLESSPDGINWQTMDERSGQTFSMNNNTLNAQFNYTYNNHVPYLFAANRDKWCFNTFGTVSVAAGATLDLTEIPTNNIAIKGLRVDMANGAGTIARFVPASSGTLELDNFPGDSLVKVEVPITLEDVSQTKRLETWSVKVNGKPIANGRVVLKDGKLYAKVARGMMVFVR